MIQFELCAALPAAQSITLQLATTSAVFTKRQGTAHLKAAISPLERSA